SLHHRRFFGTYAVALAGVAVATLLRLPLDPFLHGRAPYALYYLPILWAAWYGGVGPTVAAIAASALCARLFVIPGTEPGCDTTKSTTSSNACDAASASITTRPCA